MTRNVVLGQAAQRAATQPSSLSDFVLSRGHFLPDLVHGLATDIEQPPVQHGGAGVVQRVVPLTSSMSSALMMGHWYVAVSLCH